MIVKIKGLIKKNTEIFALSILVLITIISTNYYNYNKNRIIGEYRDLINNVYFKKTTLTLFENLEPKFKKINHRILSGETFDNILKDYQVSIPEISNIKKILSTKVNINKLKTNQKIQFTIDQKNNLVKDFIFQISNTEKIYLTRDIKTDKFNERILITNLKKNVNY